MKPSFDDEMDLLFGNIYQKDDIRDKPGKVYCRRCKMVFGSNRAFCPQCGQPSGNNAYNKNGEPLEVKICSSCGEYFYREHGSNTSKCDKCKARVKSIQENNPKAYIRQLEGELDAANEKARQFELAKGVVELKLCEAEHRLKRGQEDIRQYKRIVEGLERENRDLRWKMNAMQGDEPGRREKRFDKKMILDLIALCHPDKHGGSQKAHEVTVWLLNERQKG